MSGERVGVVLALSPRAEREVESLLFDPDAPLELLASTLQADELLRVVAERQPQAVLISPELPGLTRGVCERLAATGVRLVGLVLAPQERQALERLGVEAKIGAAVSREQLHAALHGTDQAQSPPQIAPVERQRHGEQGSVLAVIGSKGAPGASECAAALAALAAERWELLLVELDALGGGLALRLGADPNQGSLLGVIRATQAGEGALSELIERWRIAREGWPPVLLGPPDPHALSQLVQPGAITRALDALASVHQLVVCDVGFLLDDAQQPAARIHREALINADAVTLVIGASEVQLRDGLHQLELLDGELAIPPERLRIVLCGDGGPSSVSRSTIQATIATPLAEKGLSVDAWLPFDVRGAKRASGSGVPLALARPRSPYTRALTGLLDELFLPDADGAVKARRRKRRLSIPKPPVRHEPQSRQEPDEQEVALPWQS
ncbi:MAG: AAA family ATPase [Solirubrobacteraceae bacterium]